MPIQEQDSVKRDKKGNRTLLLLIAFLAGLIPGAVIAWQQHIGSDTARREVATYQIRDKAGMSAMYARRGDYDTARTLASSMFDAMRQRVDQREGSQESQNQLRQILAERDQIITLLARSDPAGADRMRDVQYQLTQVLPVTD
jgi:hypothetical protein